MTTLTSFSSLEISELEVKGLILSLFQVILVADGSYLLLTSFRARGKVLLMSQREERKRMNPFTACRLSRARDVEKERRLTDKNSFSLTSITGMDLTSLSRMPVILFPSSSCPSRARGELWAQGKGIR